MESRIRVLVVEDSLVFREVLSRALSSDPVLQVVATAGDPFEARDKIIEHEPDVMTCDVEMPKMTGIEFIRRLLPQYPLPVIVVSALNNSVFEAMSAGAVDFVGKPDFRSPESIREFIEEVIAKIKVAAKAKVVPSPMRPTPNRITKTSYDSAEKIIAIGASTGGTEAILQILKSLPSNVPGIVVAQHIPAGFSGMFAERLDLSCDLGVKEAESGDFIEKGKVLIAPGDKHLRIKKSGSAFRVECFESDKVNGHRPSVDILFESVAQVAGRNSIGIILTGMGYDGAKGLLAMRQRGARTIGQDEKTSVVYGMPKAAYDLGAVEKRLPLDQIPRALYALLTER